MIGARRLRAWLLGLALISACSDAGLQPLGDPVPQVPAAIDLEGQFCVSAPDEVVFPVKLLLVVDQSASLQCTDPENVRLTVLDRLGRSLDARPNVSFGVVGFANWSRSGAFTPDWGDAAGQLAPDGGQGGPATDYQGALATAIRVVEQELVRAGPAENARTRLVVVFVSDGVPEPRCRAGCDDGGTVPDSLYGVCNTDREIEEGDYVDMKGRCPAYNQEEQILSKVRDLRSLADTYGVAELSLSTVLLFAPDEVVRARCGDVTSFGYIRTEAEPLLRAMATEGGGTYRDADLTQDLDFLQVNVESLEAPYRVDGLLVDNLRAVPGPDGALPDSDGDGLDDATEFAAGLNRLDPDSDGDGFGDRLEVLLADRTFDPLDPGAPVYPCEDTRDRDGDGLRACEESWLGTSPLLDDSDGDRIPDGMEVRAGLDPTRPDAHEDPDQDGVTSLEELQGSTNPQAFDPIERFLDGSRLRLEPADPTEGGSRCFTWNAAAVPLAVPLGDDERARGTNPVRVMTHEAPAGIGSFGGRFHAVCLEARYLGPTFLAPASGERRDVNPRHFRELADHGLEDCLPVEVDASRPPEGG